jgi:hypothetical protein
MAGKLGMGTAFLCLIGNIVGLRCLFFDLVQGLPLAKG